MGALIFLVIEKDIAQEKFLLREGEQSIGRAVWAGPFTPSSINQNVLDGKLDAIAISIGTKSEIPLKLELSTDGNQLTYTYKGTDSSEPVVYGRSSEVTAQEVKKIFGQ